MQNHELLELALKNASVRDDLALALSMLQDGSRNFTDDFLGDLQDAGFIDHRNNITEKGREVLQNSNLPQQSGRPLSDSLPMLKRF